MLYIGVLLGLIVVALALIGFRYLTRGPTVRRLRQARGARLAGETPAVRDGGFENTAALLAGVRLTPGNEIRLLTCGDDTFSALWTDLERARRSITMQMYYAQPGRVADRCREILSERARAGVQVLFLRDAFGAARLGKSYSNALRSAGIQVATFRPVNWWSLDKAYVRSHGRMVVIDGEIGYTGGFGLDDKWLGDGVSEGQWRDTNARFTGPAVDQLQASFAAGWCEATGILLTGEPYFGRRSAGERSTAVRACLLHTAPTIGSTMAERLVAITVAAARRRLWITNAYFVPEDEQCRLLEQAAERGVDVRILTAGETNDVPTAHYGARTVYERLLRSGVRIFEYTATMHHGKTFVVDGLWCGVGTMNFDNRSMAFNDETSLLVLDETVGTQMEAIYERDLSLAKEVTLETHARRGLKSKFFEITLRRVRRIL